MREIERLRAENAQLAAQLRKASVKHASPLGGRAGVDTRSSARGGDFDRRVHGGGQSEEGKESDEGEEEESESSSDQSESESLEEESSSPGVAGGSYSAQQRSAQKQSFSQATPAASYSTPNRGQMSSAERSRSGSQLSGRRGSAGSAELSPHYSSPATMRSRATAYSASQEYNYSMFQPSMSSSVDSTSLRPAQVGTPCRNNANFAYYFENDFRFFFRKFPKPY